MYIGDKIQVQLAQNNESVKIDSAYVCGKRTVRHSHIKHYT